MNPSRLLVFLSIMLCQAACSAPGLTPEDGTLKKVTHDLCHRDVAMLGESNTHGDGHTEAFKVALVERLIDRCGFNLILFEASHHEFLNIDRRLRSREPVSQDQVSAPSGASGSSTANSSPSSPSFLARAQAGTISLGGIDDQLAGMGQDYANVTMIAELAALLPPPRQQECTLALHRRIFYEYPAATPYSLTNVPK